MKVDFENKILVLSVKDLAQTEVAEGSIVPERSLPARAALGRGTHTAHQISQQVSHETYRREVVARYETDLFGFHVTVQGRIDGVYEQADKLIVEEIKSVFSTAAVKSGVENNEYDAYLLQVEY